MKRKLAIIMVMVFCFSLLAGCAKTEGQSGKTDNNQKTEDSGKQKPKSYTFKLGYNTNEESVRGKMAEEFKKVIEEKSNGRLKVQIYPAEALGSEQEQIEAIKVGALDFSLPGGGAMSNIDPVFGTMTLPFAVKDIDEATAVLDGEFGDMWKDVAVNNGYKILGFGPLGFAQITNNTRPINEVSDMSGLKMRSPGENVLINTMKNLGASATTMAFSEVYLALSQKVVDGQFNPLVAIYNTKFHEVQDYLAMVNMFYYNFNLITSTNLWDGLDEEAKTIIAEATTSAEKVATDYIKEGNKSYLDLLESQFEEITYPDTEEFRKAVQPVYDEFANVVGADAIKVFEKSIQEYRNK